MLKKKSETELTANVLGEKKRSKTHKRLKERSLIGRNRTKRANFRGSHLFQATYDIKTEEQTINSTYLVKVGPFVYHVSQSRAQYLPPTSHIQLGIVSSLRLRWVKGVCVFRCNLPPALLAE